jgi:Protein of unknown function (DUF983)
MREDTTTYHQKRSWQACPACGTDLRKKSADQRPQYLTTCPFCGVPIVLVWWQRILIAILAAILTFAIPAYFGLGKGITLVFPALFFCFPAALLAQWVVLTLVPPKYMRKDQAFTTLFQR